MKLILSLSVREAECLRDLAGVYANDLGCVDADADYPDDSAMVNSLLQRLDAFLAQVPMVYLVIAGEPEQEVRL
jgi:hypothetical protein